MIRNKELCSQLPVCRTCGDVPALEHICYHGEWVRGEWEGWIVECGCKKLVRGNRQAAVDEWNMLNKLASEVFPKLIR